MSESRTDSKNVEIKRLPNIGSTCFMNAILQCLLWTPRFKEKLQEQEKKLKDASTKSGEVTESLSKIVNKKDEKYSSCSLLKFFQAAYRKNVLKTNLKSFLQAVGKINNQFEGLRPQDSYEMFNTIVPGLEEEFLAVEEDETRKQNDDDAWESCPISQLFGGKFITIYKYPCKHIEQNFQRFTSISIPVIERKLDGACLDMGDISPAVQVESSFRDNKQQPNQSRQGIFSLEEGLNEITQEETFTLKDLPCSICSSSGNDSGYCVKQLLVFSPPPVLVIHINRFKQSQHSGQLVKIQDEVSYPLELNLSPFVKENDKITQPPMVMTPLPMHYMTQMTMPLQPIICKLMMKLLIRSTLMLLLLIQQQFVQSIGHNGQSEKTNRFSNN